jgi:hypothetical protein
LGSVQATLQKTQTQTPQMQTQQRAQRLSVWSAASAPSSLLRQWEWEERWQSPLLRMLVP